jgi:hypothetical protein
LSFLTLWLSSLLPKKKKLVSSTVFVCFSLFSDRTNL